MAKIMDDIKITTCEGRPCWVNGHRAIFHRWTDSARPVKQTVEEDVEYYQKYSVHGLVEYEDGTVEREWPNVIQFADSWEHFQQFNWEGMERRRDEMAAAAAEIADETDPDKLMEKAVDYLREMGQDKLMEKAVDYLREMGQDLPTVNIEIQEFCSNCAHENPLLWADQCSANNYNCPECQAPDCTCKDCSAGDKWEPKEGLQRGDNQN